MLDLSWYGDREIRLSLGGPFPLRPARHPGQPGRDGIARPRRAAGRMPTGCALALDLLSDPAFDAVLTGSSRLPSCPR